jgi:hypothetical protein
MWAALSSDSDPNNIIGLCSNNQKLYSVIFQVRKASYGFFYSKKTLMKYGESTRSAFFLSEVLIFFKNKREANKFINIRNLLK